jgi:hypothetical protein
MGLRFVGVDPDTGKEGSPTVWVDDEAQEIVLQGWDADSSLLARVLEAGHGEDHANTIPDGESVIRIPARMVPMLRRACDDAEGSELL